MLFLCPCADLCSSSSSSSFQPIRSQIPIPTAHVMPSTATTPAAKPQPRCLPREEDTPHTPLSASRTSSSSGSKSSLSKSASSPNLDGQGADVGGGSGGGGGPKPDCLSRYRSLVNGLDHTLFPTGEHTRLDEQEHFAMPAMEPTLNQTLLLGGLGPDGRLRPQTSVFGEGAERGMVGEAYRSPLHEQSYRVLPETQPGLVTGSADPYGTRGGALGSAHPLGLQMGAKAYDPLLQERCGELNNWQQLENLRLQVEQMQVRELRVCFTADNCHM